MSCCQAGAHLLHRGEHAVGGGVCVAEEDGDAWTHCWSDTGNLLLISFDSLLDERETNTL